MRVHQARPHQRSCLNTVSRKGQPRQDLPCLCYGQVGVLAQQLQQAEPPPVQHASCWLSQHLRAGELSDTRVGFSMARNLSAA